MNEPELREALKFYQDAVERVRALCDEYDEKQQALLGYTGAPIKTTHIRAALSGTSGTPREPGCGVKGCQVPNANHHHDEDSVTLVIESDSSKFRAVSGGTAQQRIEPVMVWEVRQGDGPWIEVEAGDTAERVAAYFKDAQTRKVYEHSALREGHDGGSPCICKIVAGAAQDDAQTEPYQQEELDENGQYCGTWINGADGEGCINVGCPQTGRHFHRGGVAAPEAGEEK